MGSKTEKRYLLCPGYINSIHDGDRHFIGADQLARLYGVSFEECHVMREEDLDDDCFVGKQASLRRQFSASLIELRPQFNGDYRLPVTTSWQEPGGGE